MMKITKKTLDDMYRSYCASYITIGGETCALIASEEEGYPCYMYSGRDFEKRETVWEKGGGCMSIIPIPNKNNEFFSQSIFLGLPLHPFYLQEVAFFLQFFLLILIFLDQLYPFVP